MNCGHFSDGLARARAVCSARGWLPAPEARRNEETPLAPAVVQRAQPQAAAGGGGGGAHGAALTPAEAADTDFTAFG